MGSAHWNVNPRGHRSRWPSPRLKASNARVLRLVQSAARVGERMRAYYMQRSMHHGQCPMWGQEWVPEFSPRPLSDARYLDHPALSPPPAPTPFNIAPGVHLKTAGIAYTPYPSRERKWGWAKEIEGQWTGIMNNQQSTAM